MRYSSISLSELILLAVLIACLMGVLSALVFVAALVVWVGREIGMFYFEVVGSTSISASLLSALFPLTVGWLIASAYLRRNANVPGLAIMIIAFPAVVNQSYHADNLIQRALVENRFLIAWICLTWLLIFTWWRSKPPVVVQGGEL